MDTTKENAGSINKRRISTLPSWEPHGTNEGGRVNATELAAVNTGHISINNMGGHR